MDSNRTKVRPIGTAQFTEMPLHQPAPTRRGSEIARTGAATHSVYNAILITPKQECNAEQVQNIYPIHALYKLNKA